LTGIFIPRKSKAVRKGMETQSAMLDDRQVDGGIKQGRAI